MSLGPPGGILASVFYRHSDGPLSFKEIPASLVPMIETKEMIDLGVVSKGRTVVETIEHGRRTQDHIA